MNKSDLHIVSIFVFITLLGVALSFQIFQQGQRVDTSNKNLLDEKIPMLQSVSELGQAFTEHERILYEFYAAENVSEFTQNLTRNYERFNLNISRLENHDLPEDILQKMSNAYIQMKDIAEKLRVVLVNGQYPEKYDTARELLRKMTEIGNESRPLLKQLAEDIKFQVAVNQKRSSQLLGNMATLVSGFSIVIILFALIGGYQIRTRLKEAREKKRLALFLERNPNPVASLHPDGKLRYRNPAWIHLESKLNDPIVTKQFEEQLMKLLHSKKDYLTWHLQVDERYFLASLHKQGEFKTRILYLEDITHRKKVEKELEYLAFNDPLTDLPNRRKMDLESEQWISSNKQSPLSVVVIGIDRFSQVTASHGFKVGDQIILSIRDRILDIIKLLPESSPELILYRFTGAKFVLIIKDYREESNIRAWTQKIIDDIQSSMLKFIANTHGHFYLHLSFGASFFPKHSTNFSRLVQNADTAYTFARRSGGNKYIEFNSDMAEKERQWLDMEVELRVAHTKQQFHLVYQPKVVGDTGEMRGVEALIRWQHPTKGFISPADFIPVAEQSGLIIEIGEWILKQACQQTQYWNEAGLTDVVCAVNISPLQFLHHDFLNSIDRALDESQLLAEQLELEITEGVLMHDVDSSIEILNELHRKKIKVSIDDFGTGYSSLSYLKSFSLDKLKIDKSFVDNLTSDERDRAIIKTIIDLAKHLNLTVIAEGVETREQLEYLIEYGCDEIQGYYFSKPLQALEILEFEVPVKLVSQA